MNFMNVSFAETSGTFPREREKHWPIADGRDHINNPRNTCGTQFGTSPLIVSLETIRIGPFIRGKIRRVLNKTRTFRINGTFRLKYDAA